MSIKLLNRRGAAIAVLACCAGGKVRAQSQSYPSKPIRLVVPYPPGGTTDVLARLIGRNLYESWSQATIVDNRPGASGIIGNNSVAKAAPDGYTVLIGITALIQAPALNVALPYDTFNDLVPVAQIASSADLFVVNPSMPANTLSEFVAHARAHPKIYSFGSYGNGTSSHVHGEMLNMQAGLDLIHVPYKGAAAQVNDMLSGQLSTAFVDIGAAQPHLHSGKFRILAATGARRSTLLPDVPTFTELGYKSYEPYGWFGVFVPRGTPKDIVDKLSAEIVRIVNLPEVSTRIHRLGLRVDGVEAIEFARVLKTDALLWSRAIKEAQIKAD
ncbi:Bug family tripartite tricarboxylate transporter substrate binding protein [Variovorax boronicumulans]|uniref:Bug family tripartite tricarboxylate transporter substrate binding protein n=1 Tax=Variovorax boronicumulans TaxID=436515 RepID=UPI0027D8844C|nr:tripartite tricarboxylate transporter substrate binding protein [Variovorax boronicumulans]